MPQLIPKISNDFVCIVDRRHPELAAVISSYLTKPGEYLPVFEFPTATTGKTDVDEDHIDEHVITRIRSDEFDVFVSNCIGRNGGCENLILAGLSDDQKSYLTFMDKYNVIDIGNVDDVDFLLDGFALNKDKYLISRADEVLEGLYQAAETNSKLKIEDTAPNLVIPDKKKDGLIVIEKTNAASTVIAVNYALSINAEIKIVEPLQEDEEKEVAYLIEEWKKGSDARYHELSDKIHKRIGGIYFPSYDFATFFTKGLPYSLAIHDATPCTYVHLIYRPDIFVFNNILFEKLPNINSAVVFSPQFFKDEETKYVSNSLQVGNIYVCELIGKDATVYNLDIHVKEFPYDLLHICSHGGEVDGYLISETFKDRDGNSHTMEYDEVVSFAPNPYENQVLPKDPDDILIPVHRKTIFRKFDGLAWGSKEFKAAGYSNYIFADMQREMRKMFLDENYTPVRTPVPAVSGSCGIKCSISVYQAMIQVVAGSHTAPVIFNNSCWSWSGIADFFLVAGARGYIGTLWKVDNTIATQVAETLYDHLFTETILNGLQKAIEKTRGTKDEGIYIYWGLHFSTIKKGTSIQKSRENVSRSLLRSFYRRTDQKKNVASKSIQENIKRLADWNMRQIWQHFRQV
jgi:hypothetical protein